jgi:ABC-2 type transport system permease protein
MFTAMFSAASIVGDRELAFLRHLTISPAARRALDPGVTWWSWHVPVVLEVGVIIALGLGMMGVAIWEFSTTE